MKKRLAFCTLEIVPSILIEILGNEMAENGFIYMVKRYDTLHILEISFVENKLLMASMLANTIQNNFTKNYVYASHMQCRLLIYYIYLTEIQVNLQSF